MEELKSIKLRLFISILIFLTTIIVYTIGGVAEDALAKEIIMADLPREKDFDLYFNALNKSLDFCVKYQHYVDINLQFGLFLVDMNLRQLAHEGRSTMSNGMRSDLGKLLEKIDVLAEYYRSMVEKTQNEKKKVALFFYKRWPNPPKEFHTEMLNSPRIMTPEQLATNYEAWEDYHYNVYNFEDGSPTPPEIDECIALLMLNSPFRLDVRSQPTCVLRPHCTQLMVAGNEQRYFGYTLTHRILLLIVAHFSENCVVFSETTDKEKAEMYCRQCFNEAEYIALNRFQMPDLIYEQVALCSVFGHAQFVRNYWLKTLLRFQTSAGCFSESLATGNFEPYKLRETKKATWKLEGPDVIFGQCNAHFSGVAMASLSHGLRYIIENYY